MDRSALQEPAPVPATRAVSPAALGEREFKFLAQFVYQHSGIVLGPHKRQLVQGRLGKRLRQLGLTDWQAYCDYLNAQPDDELDALVSAISTNVTAFFREDHHFDFLSGKILPESLAQPARPLRIWSAGCSTGEEPYSIAMVLAEALQGMPKAIDAKILATDLSPQALATAESGLYRLDRLTGISEERRRRWFQRGTGEHAGMARVHPQLRELITFRRLNLLKTWPMRGQFDAIFCRNVVIYFNKETKQDLFRRFATRLPEGGHLFIGHSESLHGLNDDFNLIGRTIYQKKVT